MARALACAACFSLVPEPSSGRSKTLRSTCSAHMLRHDWTAAEQEMHDLQT